MSPVFDVLLRWRCEFASTAINNRSCISEQLNKRIFVVEAMSFTACFPFDQILTDV